MIEKEHFEHWIFSQPKDRVIEFQDRANCFVCSFVKETSAAKQTHAGYAAIAIDGVIIPLPCWMRKLFAQARKTKGYFGYRSIGPEPITAGEMQDAYLTLYGDPQSHPVQIEHVIEPDELMEGKL